MGRWLSNHGRWGSPIFIAGESYGGYRVGRLVRMLQETAGIGLNGAILISPALEFANARAERLRRARVGRPRCRRWLPRPPTTAARGRSTPGRRSRTCCARPRSSRPATTRRSSTRGASMPAAERERDPRPARRSRRAPRRSRRPRRGPDHDPHVLARAPPRRAQGARPLRRDDHRRPIRSPTGSRSAGPIPTLSGHQPRVHDGDQPAAALGDRRRDGSRVHGARATRSTRRGRTTRSSTSSSRPSARPTTSATACRSTRT